MFLTRQVFPLTYSFYRCSGNKIFTRWSGFLTRFEQTPCHSCESRNPFLADAVVPEAVDSCFRRLRREFSRTE
ncbi:Uncharacterized protein dnm_031860 [Desulfonema magnum]|uniref:Uncharacterized protein n=1 Tax=Desulfonema magnum TaxID=45655 RepID=A0A975BKC8_9BACT|nr:Uncharacterized protein dnm_031860 [Desulfonema magnum]